MEYSGAPKKGGKGQRTGTKRAHDLTLSTSDKTKLVDEHTGKEAQPLCEASSRDEAEGYVFWSQETVLKQIDKYACAPTPIAFIVLHTTEKLRNDMQINVE